MNDKPPFPEVLHFDPARPCCETPSTADLLPDVLGLSPNRLHRGRIATAVLESCGNGIQRRVVNVDADAWRECLKSENFRACYDLSMAKLALQNAIAGH